MDTMRVAVPDDAEAVVVLHEACWREAYADLLSAGTIDGVFADRSAHVASRRERLTDPARPTYVVERDGVLVGFATAGPARHDDAPAPVELYAIYARAAVWGDGVGHALLDAVLGDRPAYLWVLDGNDRAIGFYRRHGFALDGAEEDHPEGRHLRMLRAPAPPAPTAESAHR